MDLRLVLSLLYLASYNKIGYMALAKHSWLKLKKESKCHVSNSTILIQFDYDHSLYDLL